jgi:hypothetical protein
MQKVPHLWLWRDTMVKINISIEGEDISEIVDEMLNIGIKLIKNNRKEVREALKILSEEAFGVLFEQKTLEKGADLYKKLNSEINWTYRRDK